MGFSRQEDWSGLPLPSPGDLPDPGIEPGSPALQADALQSEPPGRFQALGSDLNPNLYNNSALCTTVSLPKLSQAIGFIILHTYFLCLISLWCQQEILLIFIAHCFLLTFLGTCELKHLIHLLNYCIPSNTTVRFFSMEIVSYISLLYPPSTSQVIKVT